MAGAVDVLAGLVASGVVVGVLSGRPTSFLQERLGLDQVIYRGLYGFERAVGLGEAVVSAALAEASGDLALVRARLETLAADQTGVTVEDKTWSVTLHYRNAPAPAAIEDRVRQATQEAILDLALDMHPGRMCCEVLPRVKMDKGIALEEEAHRVAAQEVVFCGDDFGDLVAFDALDRLAAQGKKVMRGAVVSAEAPPLLLERADLLLASPAAVVEKFHAFSGL